MFRKQVNWKQLFEEDGHFQRQALRHGHNNFHTHAGDREFSLVASQSHNLVGSNGTERWALFTPKSKDVDT